MFTSILVGFLIHPPTGFKFHGSTGFHVRQEVQIFLLFPAVAHSHVVCVKIFWATPTVIKVQWRIPNEREVLSTSQVPCFSANWGTTIYLRAPTWESAQRKGRGSFVADINLLMSVTQGVPEKSFFLLLKIFTSNTGGRCYQTFSINKWLAGLRAGMIAMLWCSSVL